MLLEHLRGVRWSTDCRAVSHQPFPRKSCKGQPHQTNTREHAWGCSVVLQGFVEASRAELPFLAGPNTVIKDTTTMSHWMTAFTSISCLLRRHHHCYCCKTEKTEVVLLNSKQNRKHDGKSSNSRKRQKKITELCAPMLHIKRNAEFCAHMLHIKRNTEFCAHMLYIKRITEFCTHDACKEKH